MIRILIADDEDLIRQTLTIHLKLESDLEMVGTADNRQTVLALIEKLNPDLVLMNLEMPEMDGLTTTQIIRQGFPETKVLIYSSHSSQDYIDRAFKAGAQGYVLKSIPGDELLEAIKLIHRGYLRVIPKLSVDMNSSRGMSQTLPQKTTYLGKKIDNIALFPSKNLKLNQDRPDLSSLPLASPDEFLPAINQWINSGVLFLLVVFGAVIFLASVLKYKVTVRADAQIRPTGELRLVQAGVEGKVTSIQVKENQQVKVGETLATISNSQLQTQQKQLKESIQQTQQQLIQVGTQMGELERQIIAEQQTIDRIITSAQADLNISQREYNDLQIITQAEVREAEATTKLAREEWERYQQLAETGVVSRSQISEKKAVLEAALARLERAKVSLHPSSANVGKAREKIAQEKARGEAIIATLRREQESLKEKAISLHKQLEQDRQELRQIENNLKDSNILAPIAGTIQKLYLRNQEQLVSRGDLIAQIAPSQVPLLIKASVASQDIAKVNYGQIVQLRVFACPYTDFGTLQGNIIAISPDISSSLGEDNSFIADMATNSTSGTYEVTIEPVSHSLSKSSQECQLKSGMKARADIITKEETVLTFILRKARLITQL